MTYWNRAFLAMGVAALSSAALLAGAPVWANPIVFPAPTTFYASGYYGSGNYCADYCPSTLAVAVADMNGDGKLDVVDLSSDSYLNVELGNGDGTFQLPLDTSIGASNYHPAAIAVGDFNGDHIQDVAVWATYGDTNQVTIYLGNGTGGFTAGSTYTAPNDSNYFYGPNTLVAADVNGDGILDLVGLSQVNGVYVFLGVGDGTFLAAVNYPTVSPYGGNGGLAVADVNGDGHPDLAITTGNGMDILLNSGTGTFGAATYYDSGHGNYFSSGSGIAIGDVNGDGLPDVAITNQNLGVTVFLNQGGGAFAVGATVSVPPTNGTSNVVLADINRDKKLDIVAVDAFGNVFTFLGNGAGAFTAQPGMPLAATTNSSPYLVAVADFNGDGTLDILDTDGIATNTVSLGRGDGTFRGAQMYGYNANGSSGHNIVAADFNGDGIPDVAYSWAINGGTSAADFAIMLGSSHGALGSPQYITAGSCNSNQVNSIATGDVNGDGIADIVATLADSTGTGCQNHTVAVLFGKGNGKFGKPAYYGTAATAQEDGVYLADVTGDGKLDIVTENSDGSISVLVNQGTGQFSTGPLITSTAGIRADLDLTLGDFNGDGKADIAATADAYNEYEIQPFVEVLLSSGNGTFGAPIVTNTGFYATAPAAADFNKDGKVDLVIAAPWGCTRYYTGYAFLRGNGNGTFAVPSEASCSQQLPGNALSPVVADLNGDGNLDVVIPFNNSAGQGPMVLQGNGHGVFVPQGSLYAGGDSAAVADFNGDGAPDIVVINNYNISQGNNSYVDFVAELLNATLPVSVSPLTVNFPATPLGSSKEETVILTNNLSKTLKITSIEVGGTNASDFSEKSNCADARKPGWDCKITVTFTPGAAGARSGTLSIVDGEGTQTVELNGTGG